VEDLIFINKDKNLEVFHISSNLHGSINYKSNNELTLKADHLIKVIDDEYVGYNFKFLTNKVDIFTKLEPVKDVYVIKLAKLNSIDLKIDNFIANLSGLYSNSNQSTIDLELRLNNYKEFLNHLKSKSTINQEISDALQDIIQLASGEKKLDHAVIKIYNSKDSDLRIGYTDINGIKEYLQQFIKSE
jgi:hypothetical protein